MPSLSPLPRTFGPRRSFVRKQVEVLDASAGRDIDMAFAGLAQNPIDALLVGPGPFLNNRREQLITLAADHKVPTIYSQRRLPKPAA